MFVPDGYYSFHQIRSMLAEIDLFFGDEAQTAFQKIGNDLASGSVTAHGIVVGALELRSPHRGSVHPLQREIWRLPETYEVVTSVRLKKFIYIDRLYYNPVIEKEIFDNWMHIYKIRHLNIKKEISVFSSSPNLGKDNYNASSPTGDYESRRVGMTVKPYAKRELHKFNAENTEFHEQAEAEADCLIEVERVKSWVLGYAQAFKDCKGTVIKREDMIKTAQKNLYANINRQKLPMRHCLTQNCAMLPE